MTSTTATTTRARPSRRSLFSWSQRISLAVVDQALFAGSNFFVNIWLARSIGAEAYGAFAVTYAIFLIIAGVHNALILEPMMVHASSQERGSVQSYIGNVFWLNLAICLALALASLAIHPFLPPGLVANCFVALPIALPCLLLLWTLRQGCYAASDHRSALTTTSVYTFTVIASLIACTRFADLTGPRAFQLLAACSLTAAVAALYRLGVTIRIPWRNDVRSELRMICIDHWRYGRWALGTTFVHSAGTTIYTPLIAAFAGLEAAGAVRAIRNLLAPLGQVGTGLGMVLLPWAARRKQLAPGRGDFAERALVLVFALVAIGYLVPLLLFDEWIVTIIYGQQAYVEVLWIAPLLALSALFTATSSGIRIALRAARRPDSEFWAQTGQAIFTLTIGIALGWRFGMAGWVAAILGASLTCMASLAFFWLRAGGKRTPAGAAPSPVDLTSLESPPDRADRAGPLS